MPLNKETYPNQTLIYLQGLTCHKTQTNKETKKNFKKDRLIQLIYIRVFVLFDQLAFMRCFWISLSCVTEDNKWLAAKNLKD